MSVKFSSLTAERLAWSFKCQNQDKNLDKKELAKEAKKFWMFCTVKGWHDCPFPEYLLKYYYQ